MIIRSCRPTRSLLCPTLTAATMLAGCATVTPGPFLITVCDADDVVLAQFQFQAGSQGALETAMVGMCRVYPKATIITEQLSARGHLQERCEHLLASMLSTSRCTETATMSSHWLALPTLCEYRRHIPEAHVNPQDKPSKIPRLPRFVATRLCLLLALALSAVAAAVVPVHGWLAHLLLGWDIVVWTCLILTMAMMLCADSHRIHAIARRGDARASAILVVACFGVVANMVAIAFELATAKPVGHVQTSHHVLISTTVLGVQLMVPMMFVVRYVYLYYHAPYGPPLRSPDEQLEPGYWDFLCFFFTIVTASQATDVNTRSRAMRRAVLGQLLLSFFFNMSIFALSINIAADLFS